MYAFTGVNLINISRIPIIHSVEIPYSVILIAHLHRLVRKKKNRATHLHEIRLGFSMEIHLRSNLHILRERLDFQYLGGIRIVTSALLSHDVGTVLKRSDAFLV